MTTPTAPNSTPSREEFVEYVRRSGLLDPDRFKRFFLEVTKEKLKELSDSPTIASYLKESGLITSWQKDRLLEGKWKGFYLGKYKIMLPIGAGAMGSVFLAEHKVMKHRVALKVLAKRLVSKANNIVRFEREARAAAAVTHPNVVRAYDIDREGDTHYLVMEYVQGYNLQKLVQKDGVLKPQTAAEYIRQASLGLNEAHRMGLVHRDIKPSNILVDEKGVVKILDLGLARISDETIPSVTIMNESKLIGTVDYLAPEQAVNSHTIDSRADIYSLGCTLYYLLTGVPPFPSGSLAERIMKHQTRRPMDINKRREGVPDELIKICNKMMEKQPARRYQTGDDIAKAMSLYLEGKERPEILIEGSRGAEDSDPGSGSVVTLEEDSSSGRSGIHAAGSKDSAGLSAGAGSRSLSSGSRSMIAKANAALDEMELSLEEPAASKKSAASTAGTSSTSVPKAPAALANAAVPELAVAGVGGGSNLSALTPAQLDPLGSPVDANGFDNLTPLEGEASPLDVLDGLQEASVLDNLHSPLDNIPAGDTISAASSLTASQNKEKKEETNHEAGEKSSAEQLLDKARKELAPQWETEEGYNYPLWVLIGSGLILSLVLLVVVLSFVSSTGSKETQKQTFEIRSNR